MMRMQKLVTGIVLSFLENNKQFKEMFCLGFFLLAAMEDPQHREAER